AGIRTSRSARTARRGSARAGPGARARVTRRCRAGRAARRGGAQRDDPTRRQAGPSGRPWQVFTGGAAPRGSGPGGGRAGEALGGPQDGDAAQLVGAVRPELELEVRLVGLDGLDRDLERLGDVAGVVAAAEQLEDLELAVA